jgi:predicted DsbA family dithiol-disulfide isomerase
MSSIRITHFSDLLCVWAYVSQVRCEELLSHFAGRVEMDCRYIHVFGSVQAKMAAVWGDRGGVAAYAAHVQSVASDFEHVKLHADIWRKAPPASSMPGHLLLCAVRALEVEGAADAGAQSRVAWRLRQALFEEARDVGDRSVLIEVAEACEVAPHRVEQELDSGRAHAELCADLEAARDHDVRSSPTLILDGGRQRLVGNVGYRVIEANVKELLDRPKVGHSWC